MSVPRQAGFGLWMLTAARLADAYVIMAKGAVVASGKTSELTDAQVKQHLVV